MQYTESEQNIYTVSRLNNEARFILEDTFPFILIEGEISNFVAPNSGHWYFSLKDASAQIKCAMFRSSQRGMQFRPKDGMHVLLRARVSLYESTGSFQLIAESMEERGEGKLRRAFEALKQKLEAAGLFDESNKKPLPLFPQKIGVITSATGAAIRDILNVLKRRFACASVIIYPTLVQGDTAAPTIVKAIQVADKRNECDVLILARGGGSLEDLWPFNEEIVAQAIYKSEIPIISGVGHEIDFTIADFVADVRAPTPSAAAELVTPDKIELLQKLGRNYYQFMRQMQMKLSGMTQELNWTKKHLSQLHPKRQLTEKMQRLDFCELALVKLQTQLLNKLQGRLKDLNMHLHRATPAHEINTLKNQVHSFEQYLKGLIAARLHKDYIALANSAAKLDALSPLATLKRGYAIATDKNKEIIKDIDAVKINEEINVKLMNGILICEVKEVQGN